VTSKRLFRVYIDESGDRGRSPSSSPFFIFAAVIVEDHDEPTVRAARTLLALDFQKPPATVLHWSENVKRHDMRRHAATTLGALPVTISYVVVDKKSLRQNSSQGMDQVQMHNYAARRLLERVSWFARDNNAEAIITFAHIKNFKYAAFLQYIQRLQHDPQCSIDWASIRGSLRTNSPDTLEILQVADLAAGALNLAITPNQFNQVEAAYLFELAPRLYRRTSGPLTTYGLHVIQSSIPGFLEMLPWWPDFPK
jgi:hypothetical protein